MRANQKVLVFCPPFSGHFNVIRDLIRSDKTDREWRLVITGWLNTPLELGELSAISKVLAMSELQETDPALWTLPRCVELLPQCLDIAKEFDPDLIIYDFFSIEGKLVGDHLSVPSWSSIPALIGPYKEKAYIEGKLCSTENQQAVKDLLEYHTITVSADSFEIISDGLHIPGELNLLWSYASVTPSNFMSGRHNKQYIFIGSSKELTKKQDATLEKISREPTIYFSLGTVVMNNLWNQQDDLREKLTSFIASLTDTWSDNGYTVIFVTQGKKLLNEYPKNWIVKDSVDQYAILPSVDLFITHGGNNSFHESLLTGVPVIVLPFFGDQPLVAKQSQALGVGINALPNAQIDTHSNKDFLNDSLVKSLDTATRTILNNSSYRQAIHDLDLTHRNVFDIIDNHIPFNEGDLLFGTNVARKKYVDDNDLQKEFTILEFKAFSELAPHKHSLPRIVDIYHDSILSEEHYSVDNNSAMQPYISRLETYKEYLDGETDFEKMCIKGLDFFSQYYKINFILSDYDPAINQITKAEIDHILNKEDRLSSSCTIF